MIGGGVPGERLARPVFGFQAATLLLSAALLMFAIRPEAFEPYQTYELGLTLEHGLFVLSMLFCGLSFGMRPWPNLPAVAIAIILGYDLLLSDLAPGVDLGRMLSSAGLLLLPFVIPHVVLEPGSRRFLATVCGVVPLVSLLLGFGLGIDRSLDDDYASWFKTYRITGAVGDSGYLGLLAFCAVVVSFNEAMRPRRRYMFLLSLAASAVMLASGVRMALLATLIFAVAFAFAHPTVQGKLRSHVKGLLAGLLLLTAFLAYLTPAILERTLPETFDFSTRDLVWEVFTDDLKGSLVFGRGFGADAVVGQDALSMYKRRSPFSIYLHLLVVGGLVGLALMSFAIAHWYRCILRSAAEMDQPFLIALAPALLVLGVTEEILTFSGMLVLWTYIGVLYVAPGRRLLQ